MLCRLKPLDTWVISTTDKYWIDRTKKYFGPENIIEINPDHLFRVHYKVSYITFKSFNTDWNSEWSYIHRDWLEPCVDYQELFYSL